MATKLEQVELLETVGMGKPRIYAGDQSLASRRGAGGQGQERRAREGAFARFAEEPEGAEAQEGIGRDSGLTPVSLATDRQPEQPPEGEADTMVTPTTRGADRATSPATWLAGKTPEEEISNVVGAWRHAQAPGGGNRRECAKH